MLVIPAIDLKGGKVVRLSQGNFEDETIYETRPAEMARQFEQDGATRIHVVDLDGALKGEPANLDAVEAILKKAKAAVQVGGGIRKLDTAERFFEMGVRWVVLGTKACLDHGFLKEAIQAFGEKLIVGIDALNGFVATDGWTKTTQIPAVQLGKDAESLGARTVIYTDISKDGMMGGPNLEQIKKMSASVSIPFIASGGISSLKDIEALRGLNKESLLGVIVGKALYEKKFSLKEAIRQCLPSA